MLSLSFRADWGYLPAHAREAFVDDESADEPAGEWRGPGAERLGLTGPATDADLTALYGRLEHPRTGEPLGQRPRRYAGHRERLERLRAAEPDRTPDRDAELRRAARRSHREARHYLDLTFSPPKSWSVYHAALDHSGHTEHARKVWDAWMEGVDAGLAHLQSAVTTTRAGKDERIGTGEWVVSVWRHHTSRKADPQLHCHAAVLNRVECEDGRWRSLDGKAVLRH